MIKTSTMLYILYGSVVATSIGYIRVLRRREHRYTDVCEALNNVLNAQNAIIQTVFNGFKDGDIAAEFYDRLYGMLNFYDVVMSADLADLIAKYGPIDENVSGEG